MITWNNITDENQLESIIKDSFTTPQLIFKHSTRCSISAMALNRFERQWEQEFVKPFYLDLLAYRKISNKISETFDVIHESPQILLVQNGVCTYETSHNDINISNVKDFLKT